MCARAHARAPLQHLQGSVNLANPDVVFWLLVARTSGNSGITDTVRGVGCEWGNCANAALKLHGTRCGVCDVNWGGLCIRGTCDVWRGEGSCTLHRGFRGGGRDGRGKADRGSPAVGGGRCTFPGLLRRQGWGRRAGAAVRA
eukprot:355452-Chlamydomonas_euryale.AAC.2